MLIFIFIMGMLPSNISRATEQESKLRYADDDNTFTFATVAPLARDGVPIQYKWNGIQSTYKNASY
jgi:hypothetical protein